LVGTQHSLALRWPFFVDAYSVFLMFWGLDGWFSAI